MMPITLDQNTNNWQNLIIIITRECAGWGKQIGTVTCKDQNNKNNTYPIPVYQYKSYAFLGFKEDKNNPTTAPLTNNPNLVPIAITQLLRELRSSLGSNKNIYLAIHDDELYPRNEHPRPLQKKLAVLNSGGSSSGDPKWINYLENIKKSAQINNKHWELWVFMHIGSSIYQCLRGENIYNCLLSQGFTEDVIKSFSAIKHRIMNLFLDLDIDYQGIKQLYDKDKSKAKEYLTGVLEEKPKEEQGKPYYTNKLSDLCELVKEKYQPDNKSAIEIIEEAKNEKNKKCWKELLNLTSLTQSITVNEESEIYNSFKSLDTLSDKAKNKQPILNEDLEQFLGKIGNYASFHDWYCELGRKLDELRDNLEKSQHETKTKILVVDDVMEYLESLKRALGDEFEIITANSIENTKNKMNSNTDIGVVLLDICLDSKNSGDTSGIELLKWIREKFTKIPVVMMSAYRDFDAVVECLNLGAEKFFKKPIDFSELKKSLKEILSRRAE